MRQEDKPDFDRLMTGTLFVIVTAMLMWIWQGV